MARSRRLKIRPILITINILLIFVIMGFYLLRMYKFYKAENAVNDNTGTVDFFAYLSNKQSYVDMSVGLIFDEKTNTYSYKGKVTDNYLLYSGVMYRIVGIDSSHNIRLVSDKSLTLMYSGLEKGFKDSYINKWLVASDEEHSGVFAQTLYDEDKYLVNTMTCDDIVDDITDIVCSVVNDNNKMSLLSLFDYSNAGGKNSYLNNFEPFYLNSFNLDNINYYVDASGDVGSDTISSRVHGVRPLITIKGSLLLLGGTGSESDPYIIESHEKETLNDSYIGEYVNFSDNRWVIVEKTPTTVKLALDGVIKSGEENLSRSFGGSSNVYSTNKNTIGNYLNNDYYNSLSNKEYIVSSTWYTGGNTLAELDYAKKYSNSSNLNVGMLSLGDFYVHTVPNTLTITPGVGSSMLIMVINDKNTTFGDLVATKYNIRPVISIKNDNPIVSGDGSKDNPYTIIKEVSAEVSVEVSGE